MLLFNPTAWAVVLGLVAFGLGGCDSSSVGRYSDPVADIDNPYAAAPVEPFYFRSASEWRQYADANAGKVESDARPKLQAAGR